MNLRAKTRRTSAESGVALLIALFTLLLICIVGMALILASGTDTALTGNYRSASSVYYAAQAGLEEGRGRLLAQSPNNLYTTFGLAPGAVPGPGQVWYIINPVPGETVAPWDTGTPTTYPDTEWVQEFPATPLPTVAPDMLQTNSISATASGSGPAYTTYKWVRINTITVGSASLVAVNVDNHTGANNAPLYYANGHLTALAQGPLALEITALAALPNGSQRMLQYVVAPTTLGLHFPAALTLNGNGVTYAGPGSSLFFINGVDSRNVGACVPGATAQAAIGYTNLADGAAISGAIVPANQTNYTGVGGTIPNVINLTAASIPANWQTASGMDALVQTITQNADVVVNGNTDQSALATATNPLTPMTIVVNGDLTMTTWSHTGYGILVVTGTLTYDPSASWMGIVLVIGQGKVVSTSGGSGEIDGAMLVAQTQPPGALGPASFSQTGGGVGIYYSTCWIAAVQKPITYKVLSFREVPLN